MEFKRSPNGDKQFQGYTSHLLQGPGGGEPRRLKLRGWQIRAAWLALLLLAVGIWAAGALLGRG
jgi:hypothetical protein